MLPLQGAWVRSLVRELRSHMPCGMAKKKKKKDSLLRTDSKRRGTTHHAPCRATRGSTRVSQEAEGMRKMWARAFIVVSARRNGEAM